MADSAVPAAEDPSTGVDSPRLSAVIVLRDGYAEARRTIGCLREQEARGGIELVVVAESRERLGSEPEGLGDFHACRVVEVGPIVSWARAAAAGVRAASAPVVALLEDHVFPAPGWAEALLRLHTAGHAAVGPAIGNATPDAALSWASLVAGYGPWLAPARSGPVADVPGHNSAYQRALLLELGSGLESLLEREGGLHAELRARGGGFYLEAAARADHLNVARLGPALALRYQAGRLAAATRASRGRWSALRRGVHAVGFPLICLVRFRSALGHLRRAGRGRELVPRVAPALLLLLGAGGLVEGVGYALGAGDSARRLNDFEFGRARGLARADGEETGG